MNAHLTLKEITATPIQEGDAGVILKKDGTFEIFNAHANIDPANMTERQLEQGQILMALSVALKIPAVMAILVNMANDPNVVGEAIIDKGTAH